ncbi:MAG: hypothetical protein RL222_978 [Bacteroidota bacterium]|jgi:hypothetical protein
MRTRKNKGKFIARLKAFIERFKAKFNNLLEQHVDTALRVTTTIKSVIDNPIADVLVKLTPTDKDDKALVKLRAAMAVAVAKLAIVSKCNENESLEEKIQCWISEARKYPVDVQHALLVKFGAILTAELDENKVPQHIYDTSFQANYSVTKENVA